MEWITILAIVMAPLIAVHIQRRLDELRYRLDRRLRIFKTLMASRDSVSRVSQEHVQALNMIDIEFESDWSDTKKKLFSTVIEAWKEYLDHLNTPVDDEKSWTARSDDQFIDLLYKMANSLGYKFNKVLLKKGLYIPKALDQQSLLGRVAQLRVMEILDGRRSFPVCIMDTPTSQIDNKDSTTTKP